LLVLGEVGERSDEALKPLVLIKTLVAFILHKTTVAPPPMPARRKVPTSKGGCRRRMTMKIVALANN